jgi:hypothetical protein
MPKPRPLRAAALFSAVMAAAVASTPSALAQTGKRIGGGCAYRSVPGTCTIASVKQTQASMHQAEVSGGPGYAGYEVLFSYKDGADAAAKAQEARQHPLRLVNSWYPGPRFLEKYGIAAGATFTCTLKIRTAGPCTPIVFDFPAIDRTDYFETRR